MPLKRTYSTSTTIVPAGIQQTKKRRIPYAKRARKAYPINGTVGKPRPFPIRMVATLRYCETLSLTSTLTSINQYCYACNSIYDPNLSGSGHQPYGHDTYANIYNQYTVLRSKIKITPYYANTASTYGVGIEDAVVGSGTGTAIDTWAERPTYKVHGCCKDNGMLGSSPITVYWNRAARFPHEDSYRSLSAPFGANPAEIEVFNVVVQQAGGSALGTVWLFVEIEYLCEMYEPKDLGSS